MKITRNINGYWLAFIFLYFLLPIVDTENTWGFHFWIFTPSIWFIIGILVLSLFTLQLNLADLPFKSKKIPLVFTLFFVLIYYHFPIHTDFYGDSFIFKPFLNQIPTSIPTHLTDALFSLDLSPANSRKTLLAIISVVSYALELPYSYSFQWAGIICGGIFTFIWVKKLAINSTNSVGFLLLIAIIASPVTLVFYNHIDNYAIIYTCLLAWLIFLLKVNKAPKVKGCILLAISWIFLLKIHLLFILLFPALLLTGIQLIFPKPSQKHIFQYTFFLKFIITPLFIGGGILYFVVFKDYNDPRILVDVKDFDRLFLPIVSPAAPYHNYNLLSINHMVDYTNIMMFWSPSLWILFILFRLKKGLLISPTTKILELTLFLFIAFLFTINPLITLPMDWDLFSIPCILFMVYLYSLISSQPLLEITKKSRFMIVFFGLINISWFYLNTQPKAISDRNIEIGKHVYKTYYDHSPRIIHSAIQLYYSEPMEYIQKKNEVIQDLKPYINYPEDIKYAMLYTDNGIVFNSQLNAPEKALIEFRKSEQYATQYLINMNEMRKTLMALQQYQFAYEYALELQKHQFPNKTEAIQNVEELSSILRDLK